MRRSARLECRPSLNYALMNDGMDFNLPLDDQLGLGSSHLNYDDELDADAQVGAVGGRQSMGLGDTVPRDEENEELAQLRLQYESLSITKKKLLREQEIKRLKEENDKLIAQINAATERPPPPPAGEPPAPPPAEPPVAPQDEEARLTIAQLRARQELANAAGRELSAIQRLLAQEQGSSGGKTTPRVKSGLRETESDTVVKHVKCPQAYLGMKYSSVPLKFDQLDLRLFIAGELNIICEHNGYMSPEHKGRLNLLQDIVYAAGHYQWPAVLNYYGQVIHELEAGVRQWGDPRAELRSQVLAPFVKHSTPSAGFSSGNKGSTRSRGSGRRDDKSPARRELPSMMYCYDFNHSTCSSSSPHVANIRGKPYAVHHICAKCITESKVQAAHPQSDASCPLRVSK